MTINNAKQLALQQVYSNDDIALIRAAAEELHIPVPSCSCVNKWNDIAVAVWRALRGDGPRYRKEYTVVSQGKRYNAATSIEDIEQLKKNNPVLYKELYI